jgi:hypothetical protein
MSKVKALVRFINLRLLAYLKKNEPAPQLSRLLNN